MEKKYKVVDWRLRPPYGSYAKNSVYAPERNAWPNRPKAALEFNMDYLIEEMDEAGIEVGICPWRYGMDQTEVGKLEIEYPGRLKSLAHINPWDGVKALEDIDKYVINGTATGITLEQGQMFIREPMRCTDRMMYPIYEKCEKEGILVNMTYGGGFCPRLRNYNPADLDDVAVDFPKMKMVISHAGFPFVTEMLYIAWFRPNVYLCPDAAYLYKGSMGAADYVAAANNYLQDKLVFGSTYPSVRLDDAVKGYLELGIKEESIQKIFWDTSAKLLGLENK